MASRISEILSILASGEDGGKSVYDIFEEIFRGIDQRLAASENVSGSVAELQSQLETSAASIVAAALGPVLASITAKADLGAILTAASIDETIVGLGIKSFVVTPESARAMFAPAHMLSIAATDDPSICMYGRRVSYDATTGVLAVEVLSSIGAGTRTSWTISPGSLASMASALSVAPASGEIFGPTLQGALAQIVTALAGKQPLAGNLTALAALSLVGNRIIGTGSDGAPTQFSVSEYGKSLLAIASADLLRSGIGAAPIANAALTGTPTAPTASVTADSNQIANITAVRAAIAALVNSSPAALDTLKELATSLGNDANFAATMTTALANKQPLDATLTALSAVVTSVDKLIYATGVDTFAVADFKAKGRAIAASSTTLGLMALLGPAFGGVAPNPSAADVGMADGNFDTLTVAGVYTTSGNWTNGPFGAAATTSTGMLEVYARTGNNFYLQIWRRTNGVAYRRWTTSSGAAAWPNAWEQIESPTVGSVSNVLGYPAGAVIERGSNANGDYVRFADGTQICWARVLQSGECTVAQGPLFQGPTLTWIHPIAFSFAPNVSVVRCGASARWGTAITTALTSSTVRVFSTVSSTSDLVIDTLAIGRWY